MKFLVLGGFSKHQNRNMKPNFKKLSVEFSEVVKVNLVFRIDSAKLQSEFVEIRYNCWVFIWELGRGKGGVVLVLLS